MKDGDILEDNTITRIEYISLQQGREFTRRIDSRKKITFSLQDEGRTLKIFEEVNNEQSNKRDTEHT